MYTWSMKCTLVFAFSLAAGCTSSGVPERQPAPGVSRIDRSAAFHSLGRWSVEENDTRLVLRSGAKVAGYDL
jgi:hypothetical protein